MHKERYLADIERVLADTVERSKKNQGEKNKIVFSNDLEGRGIIKKVAFDLYKVDNDPYNSLWGLEDIEGKQYLVRASDPQLEVIEKSLWAAASDNDRKNVTLFYKNVPIARFASSEYGFEPTDIMTFKSALLERASSDDGFVKSILSSQSQSMVKALSSTFPEFKKYI